MDRYDRYADIFDNPVTAEEIELGNRVLHHQFMENFAEYVATAAVTGRALEAQGLPNHPRDVAAERARFGWPKRSRRRETYRSRVVRPL
jgi:hypothetical protein